MTLQSSEFDVVIVGGGPAGLSAAMWCAELGLSALLLERESEFGGQLLLTHNPIKNYLGIEAENGRQLRDVFVQQIAKRDLVSHLRADVSEINIEKKVVLLNSGASYSARTIILATGVRRRKLGIPGEDEFRGKGILESGSNAGESVAGKRVMIVGGGDAALENALILSKLASKVLLVHRRNEFRGRQEFIDSATGLTNVEMLMETGVQSILGNESVESVELRDLKTSTTQTLPIDMVLIRIGVEPNTELLSEPPASAGGFLSEPAESSPPAGGGVADLSSPPGLRRGADASSAGWSADRVVGAATGFPALDPDGYILIDATCKTRAEGIYAVGDVANPISPTIATAAGMGATAAKAIFSQNHLRKSLSENS